MPHDPLPRDVPIFDCRVILSPRNAGGMMTAQVANLPEIVCEGSNERELLRSVVTAFKTALQRHLAAGGIPWQDPPLIPKPGDQERFIPVHL